eukprot:scaffold659_cov192-Ochromonas_danica.AAC.61
MSEKHLIIIGPREGLLGGGTNNFQPSTVSLLHLPHPVNQSTLCVVVQNHLYELQASHLYPRHASWFINDRVSSSKSLYFLTKLDLRFLLLPFLEKVTTNQFSPLDQIVTRLPGYAPIPLELVTRSMMEVICDVNDKLGDDLLLFRFNREKTLRWLQDKVHRTAMVVKAQRIKKQQASHQTALNLFGSRSNNTSGGNNGGNNGDMSEESADPPQTEDLRIAIEVVVDNLTPALSESLVNVFALPPQEVNEIESVVSQKRKADWEIELEREKEEEATAFKAIPTSSNSTAKTVAAVKPQNTTAKTKKANEAAARGVCGFVVFLVFVVTDPETANIPKLPVCPQERLTIKSNNSRGDDEDIDVKFVLPYRPRVTVHLHSDTISYTCEYSGDCLGETSP